MNKPDAPDVRKVAETALDLFVYAPVGLAFEARSLLPKLAQRGRNQIVLARFGARFARQRAEAEAERLLQQLQAVIEDDPFVVDEQNAAAEPVVPDNAPDQDNIADDAAAARQRPVRDTTARATSARKAPSRMTPAAKKRSTRKPPTKATASKQPRRAKSSDTLPISGYDTLSASQVVPRLAAMTSTELEAIRAYEASHRGRRTILNRVAQLQP